MIVEFSVKNFRSINELQTISFVATGLKSAEKYAEVDQNNIVEIGGMRLFKTLGIYGANASGKSNIVKALDAFMIVIRNQPSPDSQLSPLFEPFLFQEDSDETECFFQIVVLIDGKKYRYGLTVKRVFSEEKNTGFQKSKVVISNEWLFGTKEKNIGEFFTRKGKEIKKDLLPNKDNIPPIPYNHSLFLTHAAAFDEDGICKIVRAYLFSGFFSNINFKSSELRKYSISMAKNSNRKAEFLNFLASFNLNYENIESIEDEDSTKKNIFPSNKILLTKNHQNSSGKSDSINLNLFYNESAGTQKLFDLAGLFLLALKYTQNYPILFIFDEIDNSFHPNLLIKLIQLFNDPTVNKNNTQLIFNSHDTNLMSPSIMRRDQFYFTEKQEDHSTRVYSLADLKGIRNDADFAKQYLAGFYGAVPVLENYLTEKDITNE